MRIKDSWEKRTFSTKRDRRFSYGVYPHPYGYQRVGRGGWVHSTLRNDCGNYQKRLATLHPITWSYGKYERMAAIALLYSLENKRMRWTINLSNQWKMESVHIADTHWTKEAANCHVSVGYTIHHTPYTGVSQATLHTLTPKTSLQSRPPPTLHVSLLT